MADKVKQQFLNTEAKEGESLTSGGTSHVLPGERAKASFDISKMTNLIDGGPEKTKRRRFILSPTKGIDMSSKYYWSRAEIMAQHVKHFNEIHEAYWDNFIPTREDVAWMSENSMLGGALMNHYGLFLVTLAAQASAEQKAWWVFPTLTMKIVGSYAQTELGHGSNVRGLQTTAVYDKQTQEFVLNTPTLRSIKWWPGALGKVGTHAIVYAQLLIDGKEYGVHPFMVQIRDENHLPYPGISMGDLGPKFGDHGNDTGYLVLQNVRIPREFMLAAHQQVTPEGQYMKSEKKTKNEKLSYATMMIARGFMVKTSGGFLARAVTIAVRYSAVRTQGFVNAKKVTTYKAPERQIIDYQVQRYRLLKQLALSYAIKFTGRWMFENFETLNIDRGSGSIEFNNIDALPFLAATSAGLKAICTYLASQGIEDCRKCCGGNGYLLVSGLPTLAADYLWQTTAEGDFIVMMLQTASFIMKTFEQIRNGAPLSGGADYMEPVTKDKNIKVAPVPVASSAADFANLDFLVKLFQACALQNVINANYSLQRSTQVDKMSHDEAWNANSVEMLNAVRAHCYYFLLRNFVEQVKKAEDPACQKVIARVCAMYACSNILDEPHWASILSLEQLGLLKTNVRKLMDDLRPDMVALVDAFDIPDNILNSAIGRHDGNVYEALYESVKKNPLNQYEVFDGYKEILQPRLDLELVKHGRSVSYLNGGGTSKL